MLALVVREAIAQIAAPDMADRIERVALERGGHRDLPTDPLKLMRFVEHALHETIVDYLGEDIADAVIRDLEPILENAGGSSAVMRVDAMRNDTTQPPRKKPEVSKSSGRSRVLVADDDPQVLVATARVLTAEGFEVVTAADGYAALELCQSMAPDVVVADLHMPAISGRQLIQTLQRTMGREAPPVIIMTGNVFAPTHIDGAAEVLRKPVETEELTTAIELAAWDHAAGI